ncbi:MAG: peptide-methionine (S)-S-oxide reductase [Porticoccus sp.]|jgi:peptide-methionine (S)-S-oxide reductase
MSGHSVKNEVIDAENALPGQGQKEASNYTHCIHGRTLTPPFPNGFHEIILGLGCFWGAERRFWSQPGVYTTVAGYAGGYTENPTYEEVCSGLTGHAEVVKVVFDFAQITLQEVLNIFWESHNPTEGMRQGSDQGTQYRSVIYCYTSEQLNLALSSKNAYQENLKQSGYPAITTEILSSTIFYYAEKHHQQYLAKNPNGYCGLKGTGVKSV